MESKKIVFIVNVLRQARCVRRIEDFISRGYDVHVYGYNRKGAQTHELSFKNTLLETVSHDMSYTARIKMMRRTIKTVIEKEGKDSVYYLFNYDVALAFLSLNRKARYVYEISDLMELMVGNPLLKKILIAINKKMMRGALLNVFTSHGFLDFYYKQGEDRSRTLVLPNKLNKKCLKLPFPKPTKFNPDNIRFSFTGAIRSEALYHFVKTVGEMRKHEMHLFGIYSDDKSYSEKIKCMVDKYDNVYYHGKFNNPNDFPNIYGMIDVVISLYTAKDNDKYLEPNKLYESIFYEKPIVVADNTYLGKRVKDTNVGYCLKVDNISDYKILIDSINSENYLEKQKAAASISKKDSIDDPEPLFRLFEKMIFA